MKTPQTEKHSLHLTPEKVLALVRAMIGLSGGREDDEHPVPPGPWDPVIRAALERITVFGPLPDPWKAFGPGIPWLTPESVFGPRPEPWQVALASILARHPEALNALGGGHGFGEEVALNPQPLPPRIAFLLAVAQVVTSRAELLQEIVVATQRSGEQQGIIIVGGYTSRFSDDWCGNGFRLRYPFRGPPPRWFTSELDGIDLIMVGAQFDQTAKETFSPDLRRSLADASAKFVEGGLSKLQ